MRNSELDEAQAGIKIARRNLNTLRYADDTTLMHWDDPAGWYREGGGRGVQDGEHVYPRGRLDRKSKRIKACSLIM